MKNEDIVRDVMEGLGRVLPQSGEIPLHAPQFSGNEWYYVKDCLDTGWVSSVGQYVNRFERDLADYTGARFAIAAVNGTAALHMALMVGGVNQGDEVLVPTLNFIATANAVSYIGAVPHFTDSEERSLGIDIVKLERYLEEIAQCRPGGCYNRKTGRRISALVPMHTFGHPVDLDHAKAVCEKYSITLIEDAAESLGSSYKGRHTGTFGAVGVLSFNGNKIITTGGGGAILTNDDTLAKRAKHLTTTAKLPHRWDFVHDEIGYNYRLPNLNAALGCAQLENLPKYLNRKRELAERYRQAFADIQGVEFLSEPSYARSNYWLNVLLLDRENQDKRELLLETTNGRGWGTRPVWKLMHKLDMYHNCPRMNIEIAETLEKRIINIPSSPELADN